MIETGKQRTNSARLQSSHSTKTSSIPPIFCQNNKKKPRGYGIAEPRGGERLYTAQFFFWWHAPCMAHPAQCPPQEDFPFFLSRTMPTTITATIPAKTSATRIVARFSAIHENIKSPLRSRIVYFTPAVGLTSFEVSLVASL